MLDIYEAQRIVLENLPAPRLAEVSLIEALGHYLAREVRADMDIPPFDRSAMDGYALRASDLASLPALLEVVGEARAGVVPEVEIGPGQAARIMTGAALPRGADSVQIVEKTEELEGGRLVRVLEAVKPGANISPRASEARAGEVVLETGRYIGAAEIAVLATFGRARLSVFARPTVALLSTGDELVEYEQAPGPGQIRNSNAPALAAQLALLGLRPDYLGIARDHLDDLRAKIERAFERDIAILTGGVSMGAYDLVEQVFAELGVRVYFEKVAIKPGKPAVFGRRGETVVFGLPGNPVSAYVTFEWFVKPAILKLMGSPAPEPARTTALLLADARQKPGRTALLPAWTEFSEGRYRTKLLPWKGSADIIGFARANSLLIFPAERESYRAGDTVEVIMLEDHLRRRR